MRAKEFLQEYGGFLAPGPSGVRYPMGADPTQNYGGMYQGARFGKNFDSQSDKPKPIPDHIHVKKIDQRIMGGMPVEQAILARAKKSGIDFEQMSQIYYDNKKVHEQLVQLLGLTEEEISCRSDEGITVGLVDSFITNLRLFKDRDTSPQGVQEALLDIADDPDFEYFLSELKKAKQKAK